MLKGQGVNIILVGNLGQGAINKINSKGIVLIRGCSGDINTVVKDYLAGKIKDELTVCREHGDGSEHGHQCSH
jgi:predicted Fe-Mo cluster-binding NifX family protein